MPNSILIDAYRQICVPLDRLPYSEEFEHLHSLVQHGAGTLIPKQLLWERLLRIRKSGGLPRLHH